MSDGGLLSKFVDAIVDLHARGIRLPTRAASGRISRALVLDSRSPREARKFRMACYKAAGEDGRDD